MASPSCYIDRHSIGMLHVIYMIAGIALLGTMVIMSNEEELLNHKMMIYMFSFSDKRLH